MSARDQRTAGGVVTPYHQAAAVTLYQGDALDVLRCLPDESVHCVVTSPPYYGLRDYGTAQWVGGDSECDHKQRQLVSNRSTLRLDGREHLGPYDGEKAVGEGMPYRDTCGKCGAQRVDDQLGLEPILDAYLDRLCSVFDELRRVLRSDGTVWCNISDSYATSGGPGWQGQTGQRSTRTYTAENMPYKTGDGLKPKDLMLVPQRFAIEMQRRGWWVRSIIRWCKLAPMPESVTDRPTSAVEEIIVFAKSARYYWDSVAAAEPSVSGHSSGNGFKRPARLSYLNDDGQSRESDSEWGETATRNMRNYWLLAPEPSNYAHYAAYPSEIPRRAISIATSEHGVCAACGAPWGRAVEREFKSLGAVRENVSGDAELHHGWHGTTNGHVTTRMLGWQPSCTCDAGLVPATVLDPFIGSGTTAKVAQRLGRKSIGVDLSEDYLKMSIARTAQQALWFEAAT